MAREMVKIGGAIGYWGENPVALDQFLAIDDLDYVIFDYLSEITMSILARAKAKDDANGYAPDFVDEAIAPRLPAIARRGVKIISNAGGLNPSACAAAIRRRIADQGLDLKVAAITGDDLTGRLETIAERAPKEMFSEERFPETSSVRSVNAYFGAFPIAAALARGANIVICGRCADSALTLGPLIHEFGWTANDWDRLAAGSLAGHLIECGPQATGGNFTDWREAGDFAEIGYPIAEVDSNGGIIITKPEETTGLVSIGTVCEQLLYEIADPGAYILPDIVCDFTAATVRQLSENRVKVAGAKGAPPPSTYKTSLTFEDGYRAGLMLTFAGADARAKAHTCAEAVLKRCRATLDSRKAPDFSEVSTEIIGADSQWGDVAPSGDEREVVLKLAVKHPLEPGAGLLLKTAAGIGLSSPPGLSGFAGARPKPSPVVRLFSFETPKDEIVMTIEIEGDAFKFRDCCFDGAAPQPRPSPIPPSPSEHAEALVPLIDLAWARSGDKGDRANIGVIAREREFLPYIWAALDETRVASMFSHFLKGDPRKCVRRYFLPGVQAINFVLDDALGGGGVASIRNDPQAKTYAQIALMEKIPVSHSIAERLK